MAETTLGGLFEGVSERLHALTTLYRVLHCSTHGPGWTEAYFPGHRYPDVFVERSKPRADEVPPVYSEVHTVSAGKELHFHTVYQDEAQIRDLYQGKLEKFLIPSLDTGKTADEQIALIAGFVSDMVTAHVFTEANNRVWIQILLNHLLRRCGQSDAILAVPNGFAARVRYDLGAANHPAPGTEAYLDAMRLAVQTIRDAQRYYASLCALSPCKLANIAPDCWLPTGGVQWRACSCPDELRPDVAIAGAPASWLRGVACRAVICRRGHPGASCGSPQAMRVFHRRQARDDAPARGAAAGVRHR